MHYIGQTVNATVSATGTGLTYVWRWWDGSVDVTSAPATTKVINRHGTLAWSVDVVDNLGRKATYSDTVVVYKPFNFTNIEVTNNNEAVPFTTSVIWVGTHDVINEAVDVQFEYDGTLSPVDTRTPGAGLALGEISGTFASLEMLNPNTAILSGTAVTSVAIEEQPIPIRSLRNRAPIVGNPVAINPPFKIGTGTSGQMVATAEDPEGGAVAFEWHLLIANGWSADSILSGVTVPMVEGYRDTVTIPTSSETAGTKTVLVRAIDPGALRTDVETSVVLVQNLDPVITGISNSLGGTNRQEVNRIVSFYGTAADPDLDAVSYDWQFIGAVEGGSVNKNEFVCTVETAASTGTITGQLSVSDGFGGADVLAIDPVVVVGSAWVPVEDIIAPMAAAVDDRIAVYSDKLIYSTQDHATPVYVRNTSCWAASFDLTCCSPWNSQSPVAQGAGVLVTPKHVLFASHNAVPPGETIRFVAADNTVHTRTLVSVVDMDTIYGAATLSPDLAIGRLDSVLPASITPCKILPKNWNDYIPGVFTTIPAVYNNYDLSGYQLPVVQLDQEEKALINEIASVFFSLIVDTKNVSYQAPTGARAAFYEILVGGDSGNPAMLIVDGSPVLVSVATATSGAGTMIAEWIDEINAELATMGDFERVVEANIIP